MLEERNLTSDAADEALAGQISGHIVQNQARRIGDMAEEIRTRQWD